MKLQDLYRRAARLSWEYAVAATAGYVGSVTSRSQRAPTPEDLDRGPLVVARQGQGVPWRVTFAHKLHAGTSWREFDAYVKSATSAALAAHKNLKAFSASCGVQYATLWRAKDGRGVTKGIIELMGQVPDVLFVGLDGVVIDDAAIDSEGFRLDPRQVAAFIGRGYPGEG